MNKEIEIMIELQRYWDNVVRAGDEIEKCTRSIVFWDEKVNNMRNAISSLDGDIKNIKASIKQKEIDIIEKDEKKKKLTDRKTQLKTEREVSAVEHELSTLQTELGILEEDAIRQMDALDLGEKKLSELDAELQSAAAQAEKDIAMLKERIGHFEESARGNTAQFNDKISQLPPMLKTRFQKLTSSGTGKAIAKIEGETCGGCNTRIPVYIAIDAGKDDKIVNCTNCGRFLHK